MKRSVFHANILCNAYGARYSGHSGQFPKNLLIFYGFLLWLPLVVVLPCVEVLPLALVPLAPLPAPVPGTAAAPALSLALPSVTVGAASPVPSSALAGTGGPSTVGSASKLLRYAEAFDGSSTRNFQNLLNSPIASFIISLNAGSVAVAIMRANSGIILVSRSWLICLISSLPVSPFLCSSVNASCFFLKSVYRLL